MQVNHVRLNLIKSCKKAFCSNLTMKTSLTVYASLKHIKLNFCVRSELHFVWILRIATTTPKRIGLFASSEMLTMIFHHDAAGRTVGHSVYMGIDRHYRLFLHTILSTTPV